LKLVQEKAGNTLEATGIDENFLSRIHPTQQLRESINKWHYMELNSFCTTKEIVCNLEKTPTEWEKILACYT
jgi:hypothetical protein